MRKLVTMNVNIAAAYGADYITATARPLRTWVAPGDSRPEAAYKAVVALDTNGSLQVIWWTNSDASVLQESHAIEIPKAAIDYWRDQINEWASKQDSDELCLLGDHLNECLNKEITVGDYIRYHNLLPDGYDNINDEQEIEATYTTPKGDEMIVFGAGQGRIISPAGATSIFESGDIDEYLELGNNRDWSKGND